MHPDVSVCDLGDTEIRGDRQQGVCIVLGQAIDVHQESPPLAERVSQGAIHRRAGINIGLGDAAEVSQVIFEAETLDHLFVAGLDDRGRQAAHLWKTVRLRLVKFQADPSRERHL